MKTLLFVGVLFCAAVQQTPAQNIIGWSCYSLNQGTVGPYSSCGDFSQTALPNGVVYAMDEIQGVCDNGLNPYASSYAFAACGPEIATSNSGPNPTGVFSFSGLSGVVNDSGGTYRADCYGGSGGDGEDDGQCDIAKVLCWELGGFCDA